MLIDFERERGDPPLVDRDGYAICDSTRPISSND
jgi:hypothetical protein